MTKYGMTMTEALSHVREGFSPKLIKQAIGIASDKRYAGGNMSGAVDAIEKLQRGLSDHPQVMAVLKRQNEDVDMQEGRMKELHHHIKMGKSAKEIAKIMKLDFKTINALVDGLTYESVEEGTESLDEKYDIYHKTFSGAMQHSYEYAKKKFKIEIDPTEIDDKVAMGPPKPKNGKTNSYRLKGKNGKGIQVQVYNTGTSFELNMYKESVDDVNEDKRADDKKRTAKELSKKDFVKAYTWGMDDKISKKDFVKKHGTEKDVASYWDSMNESVELDEDFMPLFFALWGTGAMLVLPALMIYDVANRNSNYKLDAKVGEIVGKLLSKFKKDKNYKPNSAEIDASKKLEKEVKSKEPSIFNKAMSKLKSIKSKKEEVDLDEGFFTKEYESGQFKNGDETPFVDAIKKSGGKNIDITKPDRREPMLTIEFDGGDVKKIKSLISKVGDGTEELDEASKEGTIRIIDLGNRNQDKIRKDLGVDKLGDSGFQVQVKTKGKFVNVGKPYKTMKDAEKVRKSGQHSLPLEMFNNKGAKHAKNEDIEQNRDDTKTTRIAQLNLQIAKAKQTINKLNNKET